jgi:hypothetical protein
MRCFVFNDLQSKLKVDHMTPYGRTISNLVENENNSRVWPHALSMLEPDKVKISRPSQTARCCALIKKKWIFLIIGFDL